MGTKKTGDEQQGVLFPETEYNDPAIHSGENEFVTQWLYAIVKPEMLLWGRQYAYLSLEEAAKKIGVTIDTLREWENGISSPTVNKLHIIARVYKQLFAVFFLQSPPKPASLPLKDFRRLPTIGKYSISYELASEIRIAMARREIAIRLVEETGEELQEFQMSVSLEDSILDISKMIRTALFSDLLRFPSFVDKRKAFNFFRERVEHLGILVFQASSVGVDEMRGFSLSESTFPVIVVNRKDSLAGRIFSLFHELTHILLRTSGLCEIDPDITLPPEEQKLEVFCNKVAAEILMPAQDFIENAELQLQNRQTSVFSDIVIESLSNLYGVSREAVVRRLLTLNLVTKGFYQTMRSQYQQELSELPEKKEKGGPISPAKQIISLAGKPYCNLILGAISENRITVNDASGYLNVRINQINKVVQLVGI